MTEIVTAVVLQLGSYGCFLWATDLEIPERISAVEVRRGTLGRRMELPSVAVDSLAVPPVRYEHNPVTKFWERVHE